MSDPAEQVVGVAGAKLGIGRRGIDRQGAVVIVGVAALGDPDAREDSARVVGVILAGFGVVILQDILVAVSVGIVGIVIITVTRLRASTS
jgi:hypothetical protein